MSEKIKLIRLWNFDVDIVPVENVNKVTYFCRLESEHLYGRTMLHNSKDLAVNEALQLVVEWVEDEVTTLLGEKLT